MVHGKRSPSVQVRILSGHKYTPLFRQSTTPFPTTTAKTTTTTKSNSRGGPVMRSSIDKSNDLTSTTVAKPKKQNEDQFT